MIARELQMLCPSTITVEPFASADSYSKPTTGTAVQYACLIAKQPKMVRTATGQERVSTSQIYLTSAPGVTVKDKVTLPDATTPVILHVDTYQDTAGDYFEVIYT